MRENHRHPLSFSAHSVLSTSPFSSVHCVQCKDVRVVHFAFTGASVLFYACPDILLPPTQRATQLARTNNLFKRSWLDRAFTGATSWKVDKCLGWGQTLHFKVRFTCELSEAQRVGGLHDCIKLAVTPAKIQAFTWPWHLLVRLRNARKRARRRAGLDVNSPMCPAGIT